MPIYTKTLPNLTKASRAAAYQKLSTLLSHLDPMDNDLISVSIDVPTRVVTVVVANAFTNDELDHFGML